MPHRSHPPSFLILILHRFPKNQVVKTCSCGILQAGVQTTDTEWGIWVSTCPRRTLQPPHTKFPRFVRFSFRSLAARAKMPAVASEEVRRCRFLEEAGERRPPSRASSSRVVAAAEGQRRARSSVGLGGAAPRRALPAPTARAAGPLAPRGARGARGPWGLGRGGALGGGGRHRGTRQRPPRPTEVRPRAGLGSSGRGSRGAAPRPSPAPERVLQAAPGWELLCLRLGSGESADLLLRGRCECASWARPPASRLPCQRLLRRRRRRRRSGRRRRRRRTRPPHTPAPGGGPPRGRAPAAAAEPGRTPHAARPPGGLVLLPNFAKSPRVLAALGRASALRLASQPQRPREQEEEPPPQHQRDRIPAAWGGVMLCGL